MVKTWSFPAGERGVRIDESNDTGTTFLALNFTGSDSIMDLLFSVDALRRMHGTRHKICLEMPYVPYARQDRVMVPGESYSLVVFAKLINDLNLDLVRVVDPHSDVTAALISNINVTEQYEACIQTVGISKLSEYDYLIAPDAGALKKIYKLAKVIKKPVICAEKKRDVETGEITGLFISEHAVSDLQDKTVLVVDDICDGGKTFIELSKVLPSTCKPDLYVTHGIFSKGKDTLNVCYNNVFCYNDMSIKK